MLNDMLIFSKSYDFLKSLYPGVNRFPKSQRFTLGQRIENSALSFLEHVIAANSARDKTPVLEKADLELEKLRIFIRLAHDYNFIGMKQYENASASIAEFGRLLGGWKSVVGGFAPSAPEGGAFWPLRAFIRGGNWNNEFATHDFCRKR